MAVVLGDALIKPVQLAQRVANRRVGPAGQILQVRRCLTAHRRGLLRQHDPELAQEATDAVDGGGALLDQALAHPVHAQPCLLVVALDRNKAHVRPLHGLADRPGVGGVVLAALAAHPIGCDELGRHQPNSVALLGKEPGPVMRSRAGLHANGARWQGGHQLMQPGAWHARPHQRRLAVLVDSVDRENVLGEIDPDVQNGHGLPLPSELMRLRHSHRGTQLPVAATRLARDGEVPSIR